MNDIDMPLQVAGRPERHAISHFPRTHAHVAFAIATATACMVKCVCICVNFNRLGPVVFSIHLCIIKKP